MTALSGSVLAQYCGGRLQYLVRGNSGEVIDALDVKIVRSAITRPGEASTPVTTRVRGTTLGKLSTTQQEKITKNRHLMYYLDATLAPTEGDLKYAKPDNTETVNVSTFGIAMGCGSPLAELSLEYNGKTMNLRFRNIVEFDGYIDSVPFQAGTFEADIQTP
ncbi:MAG: hypothetical protein ABL984_09850 [Pyrinomonadaceae bacterium]